MSPLSTPATPRLSVVMSVRDGEPFLREAVESVLGQTHRDLELIVVDDGSTDGTLQILESIGDPRLRVLRNERNEGLARSLNRGLRDARALYIARQDADDVSDPTRFARQIAFLDANERVMLVGTGYRRIDDRGRTGGERIPPLTSLEGRWRLLFLNAFAHSSVMLRRSALDDVGLYDETFWYAPDYDLWSRLANAHEVAGMPDILVSYRRSSSSLTATYAGAKKEVRLISRRNMEQLLELAGASCELELPERDVAWRLLFGDFHGVAAEAARMAAPEILALQHVFGRVWGGSPTAARRHRRTTAAMLARRLAVLGLAQRNGRTIVAAMRAAAAVKT